MGTTASLKSVADFFLNGPDGKKPSGALAKFTKEWQELSPEDKVQLSAGIGDGTLNY